MEELLFRGMILKRARRFGDRTAVAFTAVLFGLMHGNLLQFFYAASIGLILGYVAVRTSSIRYTVLMHMAINSFSTVMVAGPGRPGSGPLFHGIPGLPRFYDSRRGHGPLAVRPHLVPPGDGP